MAEDITERKANTAELRSLKHSYDPLSDTYEALLNSAYIKRMSIGDIIAKEIMIFIPYIESTLDNELEYTKMYFASNGNDSNLMHLITMPIEIRYKSKSYILKSFTFTLGALRHWTDDGFPEISIKIAEFDPDHNKRIINNDKSSFLYESPNNIIIRDYKAYQVTDINIKMHENKMYIIEPYVVNNKQVGSGIFKDSMNNINAGFEEIKFVRSDLAYYMGHNNRDYYVFEHYVKRFECEWVLFE